MMPPYIHHATPSHISGTALQAGPMIWKNTTAETFFLFAENVDLLSRLNKRVKLFRGADGWFAHGVTGQLFGERRPEARLHGDGLAVDQHRDRRRIPTGATRRRRAELRLRLDRREHRRTHPDSEIARPPERRTNGDRLGWSATDLTKLRLAAKSPVDQTIGGFFLPSSNAIRENFFEIKRVDSCKTLALLRKDM